MVKFHILQKLMTCSEDKNYPQLMAEWEVVDGARKGDDFVFTLENNINHNRIPGVRLDDLESLERYSFENKANGFRKLYQLCDVINNRFTENRTDRIVNLLSPELIDLLSEKCMMAANKYNGGDPSRDIEFLRKVEKDGTPEQSSRARVYSLFTYDSIPTRKIASYCHNQSVKAAEEFPRLN